MHYQMQKTDAEYLQNSPNDFQSYRSGLISTEPLHCMPARKLYGTDEVLSGRQIGAI